MYRHNIKPITCFVLSTIPLFQKIVSNPSFVVDGVSRFDFGQGMIGKENTAASAVNGQRSDRSVVKATYQDILYELYQCLFPLNCISIICYLLFLVHNLFVKHLSAPQETAGFLHQLELWHSRMSSLTKLCLLSKIMMRTTAGCSTSG